MNFGEILEKWEKKTVSNASYDKVAAFAREESAGGALARGERRSRLLRKAPDDSIDIHGLSRDEAWIALENFFDNCRGKGCEKVLIIHGKGNHHGNAAVPGEDSRPGESALRTLSRRFIESCPFAGESGHGSAKEGGTGATWVILKE
ncbi:MAG: Smr/MutS family protein [Treponema sp.]|nr:Smr/MutS family protein [Treponema sp.]